MRRQAVGADWERETGRMVATIELVLDVSDLDRMVEF